MLEDLDLARITDAPTRELVQQQLNRLEDVTAELQRVQADNQRLRDEINRLKGEQGTPPSPAIRRPRLHRIIPRNARGTSPSRGRKAAR